MDEKKVKEIVKEALEEHDRKRDEQAKRDRRSNLIIKAVSTIAALVLCWYALTSLLAFVTAMVFSTWFLLFVGVCLAVGIFAGRLRDSVQLIVLLVLLVVGLNVHNSFKGVKDWGGQKIERLDDFRQKIKPPFFQREDNDLREDE